MVSLRNDLEVWQDSYNQFILQPDSKASKYVFIQREENSISCLSKAFLNCTFFNCSVNAYFLQNSKEKKKKRNRARYKQSELKKHLNTNTMNKILERELPVSVEKALDNQ